MSSLKKKIGTLKKKRRNFSISNANSTDLLGYNHKEDESSNQAFEGLSSLKETLINILKHLDNILRKYKEEERSTTHICSKVSEILNNYQITTNETTHSKFLAKIKWMKEYISRIQDPNLLHIFEKALNEVGDLLLKEDLKRLAINPENNNQGHLALGSSNNTEYLENIRIYLFDDTFKNFMVSVNDTVAELMQRIIGKISCLGKNLNDGFALWEIPHDLEQGQRKLLNSDLPVLIKRSWRRPSKFYFLTKKEEEVKIVKTDLGIKNERRKSIQPTLLTPSGLPVKVYFQDDLFKMFLIQKKETCIEFKSRVVTRFMEAMKKENKHEKNSSNRLSSSNDSIMPIKNVEGLDLDTIHQRSNSSPVPSLISNPRNGNKLADDFSLFLLDDKGNITELKGDINLYRHIERLKNNFKLLLHQKISDSSISKNLDEKVLNSSQSRLYEAFLKLKDGNRKKINFQGLSLELVPEELNTLQLNPISIDFSNNLITFLPEWMKNYSNIKVLNLSSNKLDSIPSPLTGMVSLQILDLSQNNIKNINEHLFSMTQLKSLYLNYNKLETIPDNFSNLTDLTELTLTGNYFKDNSLDPLQHLKSLKMLDLSSNKLSYVPNFIISFTDLEELYLSCNEITEINTDLYGLINLRSLDLSQNSIVTIPNGIQKLSNLQELLMDYNPIISSPLDELEVMDQLSIIKIPNIDDFLIARKNMRMDRRLSNHRSTTNASLVDILIEQNGLNVEKLDEEPKKINRDKVLFKSSSYHNSEEYDTRDENDTDGGENKPSRSKTGSKRKKFSQKKFPTEPEIKIPSDSDSIIDHNTEGYHIELERDLGVRMNELFTPLSLKFNYNQDDYFTNFHGLNHINFLAIEKNLGPTIISVLMIEEMFKDKPHHRVLIKNKLGDETLWLSLDKLKNQKKSKLSMYTKIFSLINKNVGDKYTFINVRLIEDKEFIDDILDYESRMASNAFKFGVIYAGKERTENDIYGLKEGSKEFNEFINFLGEKVRLKGWKNYSAGLDVENDRTGKWSIYQRWSTMEIMFHISTFLPYDKDDDQQIERKKHIGNDIVVIIFQDENALPFDPSIMRSFFNHIFVVIRPIKFDDGTTKYRVSIASKDGVKEHTPYLPKPAIFDKTPQFRKFLLTKLVNAERASYHAPNFLKALSSAREQLLNEISKKCSRPENKGKIKKIKAQT